MSTNEVNRITLKLETQPGQDLIPANSFKIAIDELTTILHEVELEISQNKRGSLNWGVADLSVGSATISLENVSDEIELGQKSTISYIEGLQLLNSHKIRPEYFNDNALESAQRLARLTSDGVSKINVFSHAHNLQLYVTEQIAVNIADILEHIEYLGSVEGSLELISGRDGYALFFRVRDVVSGKVVRCFFPENILDDALNAFRKRVIVYGLIKSDNIGNPRTIRVQNMETLLTEHLGTEFSRRGVTYKANFYGSN